MYLGLFVHAQHEGTLGWVEIQADDVVELVHEVRVGGQLPVVDFVRFELECPPDSRYRGLGQPGMGGHHPRRPVRAGVRRSLLQRGRHHLLDLGVGDRAWPAWSIVIRQPGQPVGHEPGPPLAHHLRGHRELGRHILVRRALRARQHDLGPKRERLGTLGTSRPPLQRLPLLVRQHQLRGRSTRPRHRRRLPDLWYGLTTQDTSTRCAMFTGTPSSTSHVNVVHACVVDDHAAGEVPRYW